MNIFRNLNYKIQQMMVGRYGYDELNKAMLYGTIVFFLMSSLTKIRLFYFVAVALLVYSYFRMFSKNFPKRRSELNKYNELKRKFLPKINLFRKKWQERNTHKYFTCPKCKATFRYPKGMGKIEITCKNCKYKMIKKT